MAMLWLAQNRKGRKGKGGVVGSGKGNGGFGKDLRAIAQQTESEPRWIQANI